MVDIKKELEKISKLSLIDQEIKLQMLKKKSGIGITSLRQILKSASKKVSPYDIAKDLMKDEIIITSYETDKMYIYEDGIFVIANKKIAVELQKRLKAQCSDSLIDSIMGHVKRETYKTEEEISVSNKNCLCLKNGILNIETRELKEFSSDKIFFNKLPVEYHVGVKCPKFEEFIRRACLKNGDVCEEKRDTIQEYMGFSLEEGYNLHKVMIIYGDSDTSKTQFMIVWQNMLGEDNYESIYPQQLFKDNYTSMLHKKMANIADEIPSGVMSTTKIKALSGESQQTVRELYEKPFKFINHAKLIFAGNKLPKLKEEDFDDDAVFNRPLLIKFNNKVADKDKVERFGLKLFKEESSGILNWMLDGLNRLQKNKKFSDSQSIEDKKMIWLSETEPVYRFFVECGDVELVIGEHCKKVDLYDRYVRWCEDQQIQWLENNAFGRKINTLFRKQVNSTQMLGIYGDKQEHCWSGIKLREINK